MKKLAALILLLFTSIVGAEEPLPGIYRGYVTITRSNKALGFNEVTTLIIVGELRNMAPGESDFSWLARNLDQSGRLHNLSGNIQLVYSTLPLRVPETGISGDVSFGLPGGDIVPGSFKMTSKSLAWKCTEKLNIWGTRNLSTTTSFSITRSGSSPAPDP
jgi:hypothetical protein